MTTPATPRPRMYFFHLHDKHCALYCVLDQVRSAGFLTWIPDPVNAHDALLAALRALVEYLDEQGHRGGRIEQARAPLRDLSRKENQGE